MTDRGNRRLVIITAALAGLWLPTAVGASPPSTTNVVGEPADGADSRFSELPDPDELPDLAQVPAPAARSSPPQKPDKSDQAEADDPEPEAEAKPKSKPSAPASKPSKPAIKQLAKAQWIKHEVIPGERLDDIAARYDVQPASLIRWNKLNKDKPRIYAGHKLAVYTKRVPPPQQKITYTVKYGDTWNKIASAHHVDPDHLRQRWNPKVPRTFKAGQELIIWVDPLSDPDGLRSPTDELATASAGTSAGASAAAITKTAAVLPVVAIPKGAVSVGTPNKGKIVNSIALPENKKLYTIRKPDECYGSSHALYNLQLAIAQWRQATAYSGALMIGAISKKGGGRLRPHSSHQSGRDVDIRLPLQRPDGDVNNVNDVDWDATWGLILALVGTGEVEYIFLTTDRQKHLLGAAKRAGASKDLIERILQYPETSGNKNGIVRNQKGHTAHIHVRFLCAANETRCETY